MDKVLNSLSEVEIIEQLKDQNDLLIKMIYNEVYPSIRNLIINNSGNEVDAKDIFQEAIIVLYNKAKSESFKLECKIKTYIYSICRRLWLNELKRKTPISSKICDHENFIVFEDESEMHKKEIQLKTMYSSLELLGEPCHTILKDFYIEKMNMDEIAEKMGYTNKENAKNQKYKCLQRLKKIFFKQYISDENVK